MRSADPLRHRRGACHRRTPWQRPGPLRRSGRDRWLLVGLGILALWLTLSWFEVATVPSSVPVRAVLAESRA